MRTTIFGAGARRRAFGSLLVLLGLLAALALAPSSTTEGSTAFKMQGRVFKTNAVITGACQPGNLNTDIPSGANPSYSTPHFIAVTGTVAGCMATDHWEMTTKDANGELIDARGTLIIGNELFTYATISAKTTHFIGATDSSVQVENLVGHDPDGNPLTQRDFPDQFPLSGQLLIDQELVSFTRSTGSDVLSLYHPDGPPTARNGTSHEAGALVRVQGRLKLLQREQPTYNGGPATARGDHTPGVPVSAPKTFFTCRTLVDSQTDVGGPDPITTRARCYSVLEPGRPSTFFWKDYPDLLDPAMPVLPLIDGFFHELAAGTIADDTANPTTTMTLTAEFLSVQCFTLVTNRLWSKAVHTTTVDQTALNQDLGQSRIFVYTDSDCATAPVFTLGTNDMLPNKSVPAGTNLSHVEIGATVDTDFDGCPDAKELGSAQGAGGRRDPFNAWDYFEPSGNGQNRVNDILIVVGKFGLNAGDPGYTQDTDRTTLGPDKWNLGKPNGQQRVDDIIHSVNSFGNDCSS